MSAITERLVTSHRAHLIARHGPAVARFCVVVAVLLAPWPGLGSRGSDVFILGVNAAASFLLPSTPRVLRFEPGDRAAEWRPRVIVRDITTGRVSRAVLQVRRVWYVPLALYSALAVAWPLPRRWTSWSWILGGAALLHGIAGVCVLQFAAYGGVVVMAAWCHWLLTIGYRVVLSPGVTVALPLLLWLFIRGRVLGFGWLRALVAGPAAYAPTSPMQ